MTYVNKGQISPRYMVSSLGDGNYDDVDGTSDEDQINQAINDLTSGRTWPEKVLLKGTLVIDDPIVVPAYTHIENTGRVYLEDSSECNMLQNANPASNDVQCIIEGGIWNGNKANNTNGDIIYWEHSTQPADNAFKWTTFRDMILSNAADAALHVDFASSSESNLEINHVQTRLADVYGFELYDISDGIMDSCQNSGNQGLIFEFGGFWQVNNCYFNQRVWIKHITGMYMTNIFNDVGQDQDGLYINGSQYGHYENINVRCVGDSGFTGNAAIMLDSAATPTQHATNNTFVGVKAGRFGRTDSNRWNYIIEESNSNQAENMYKDIDPDDFVTAVADINATDVQLDFLSVPFVLNRDGATEADHGIDVSGVGEHAVANVNLPSSVHQLVWLVIDAYVGAAPGAGDTMEIDLRINGASDNQPWGTHTTTIANLQSIGTNYLVGDVGYWRTRANDSAGILALIGGDSVQIDVYHEVGSGDEADTNAEFRSATLWYV